MTPERINARIDQNTSPEHTGEYMLIPGDCLKHSPLQTWFAIADLKIPDMGT